MREDLGKSGLTSLKEQNSDHDFEDGGFNRRHFSKRRTLSRNMSWFVFETFILPQWLRSIATAAVGALLAYATWSWLHSPYLFPDAVVHQEIVEVDEDESQQSIRLPVMNIGTKAAKNCEAVLRLVVPIGDDVVRSFHPVPWLPRRAELVVNDEEHTRRTTIPAGRGGTVELIRQYRNGNTQIYPHIGGDKFIRTSPKDTYHREIDEGIEYAVLSPSGSRDSDKIRTTGVLYEDEVSDAEWENAVVELMIETESSRPLEVTFDAYVDDEGVLTLERRPQPLKRRAVSWLYRGVNKVRKIGS